MFYLFSITPAVFRIFPSLLAFSKLIMMCLNMILLGFILPGVCCTSWIWFYSFHQIWKIFSHYSTKYYFMPIPPALGLLLHLCQAIKNCTTGHWVLFSFQAFFIRPSVCVASTALFSSLPIFSSAAPSLLISVCIILFLIWYCMFYM